MTLMSDEERKIFVDDDWKAEAKKEKERLAEEQAAQAGGAEGFPAPSFAELVNLVVTPALAGFGLMAGPDGQRIPPNMALAKHYIDVLQVLEEKTRGNLADDEKQLLDQVLYELRMRFVELTQGGGGAPGGAGGGGSPEAGGGSPLDLNP
jgi:hypothetical protein